MYNNKNKEFGVAVYKEGDTNESDVYEASSDEKSCDVEVDAWLCIKS